MEGSPAASGVPHPQDRLDCSRLAEVVGPRRAGTTSPVLAPVHAAVLLGPRHDLLAAPAQTPGHTSSSTPRTPGCSPCSPQAGISGSPAWRVAAERRGARSARQSSSGRTAWWATWRDTSTTCPSSMTSSRTPILLGEGGRGRHRHLCPPLLGGRHVRRRP
ncbi:hypothetical protein VPH35_083162 [Triticum aestivum]